MSSADGRRQGRDSAEELSSGDLHPLLVHIFLLSGQPDGRQALPEAAAVVWEAASTMPDPSEYSVPPTPDLHTRTADMWLPATRRAREPCP